MTDNKKLNGGGRNYSLDLLRIVAMLMVLTLHINQGSGYLGSNTQSPFMFAIKVYEHIAIVAVDLFIIISAWFLREKQISLRKLVTLLATIIFWTIVTNVVAYCCGANITLKDIAKEIPIIGRAYDFMSGYIVMYLLSPFINKSLDSISHKTHKYWALASFVLFSLLTPITTSHYIYSGSGYHIVWFVSLYIITTYLKTISLDGYRKVIPIVYVLCLITGFASDYFQLSDTLGSLSYNNPIVAVSALCLFILFTKLEIKNKFLTKLIGMFAPFAFAVYLIHANPILWRTIEPLNFDSFFSNNASRYIFTVPIIVMVFYLVFSLLEFLRLILFKKCKITDFLYRISDDITKKMGYNVN